jgi:Carboxypeptidase regulatory-like domain
MCSLRTSGPLILTALLTATLSPPAHAQFPQIQHGPAASPTPSAPAPVPPSTAPADVAADKLPDAPATHISTQQTTADQHSGGSIVGTVLDAEGAEVTNAVVTLENTDSKVERTLTTDSTGFYKFDAVEPGRFSLTITSTGFATWVSTGLALHTGESYDVPPVALEVASAMTNVEVTVTRHDIAEDQMHFEEKQRVLGVFPNFYASYVWNAAPLSAGQKFRLASRTLIDPVTIAIPAIIAGVELDSDDFNGYGQGTKGYAKRFGAAYADGFTSTMLGDAILPSLLHQDPRYFYKGTGSIRSRALYAIATVVICKGDNGHWQPNYSNVLGNLASAGISNLYYPSADESRVRLMIDNWLVGTVSGAASSLFQEFLVKKISRGVQSRTGP